MKAYFACLAIALLSMLISGCTVIGLGFGLATDHNNRQPRHAASVPARRIPRGRLVEITLVSGDTLRGTFTGLRILPADSYRCAYDSARILLGGDSVLPQLGEPVFATCVREPRISGSFGGFEAEALLIRSWENNHTAYVALSRTVQLRNSKGRSLDVERLRALAASHALPSTREFTMKCANGTCRVPLNRIQAVYLLPQRTHHWILLGLGGAVVDFAALAAYASTLTFWSGP